MYTCRECENEINQATEVCPHCGTDLTEDPLEAGLLKPRPTTGKVILRWGILLGVLLAAIWSFLWFVVPERQGDPTAQAEARAAQSLRNVDTALVAFASAQGGAYPNQLETLGEKVRLDAQAAQSVNYRIQYTPGPVEADGTIRTFALQARAGNFGFRSFYLDDTGTLRATKENRTANSGDPPY